MKLVKHILLEFAPIMPALIFCSLFLTSYYSYNFAGKIKAVLMEGSIIPALFLFILNYFHINSAE